MKDLVWYSKKFGFYFNKNGKLQNVLNVGVM